MEKEIKALDVPLLANGDYLNWMTEMSTHLAKLKGVNISNDGLDFDEQPWGLQTALVEADKRYSQVFDIFLNERYIEEGPRDRMEKILVEYNDMLGYMMIELVLWAHRLEHTPSAIGSFYDRIIDENDLTVLQGGKEPVNTGLQIGHWENYIESDVGWSLRGAFNIIAPADVAQNSNRDYMGSRISHDSVYVMRIKQWDIIQKLTTLCNYMGNNPKKKSELFMDIWLSVFNYLNFINAKPRVLFNSVHSVYNREINLLIKIQNESNN